MTQHLASIAVLVRDYDEAIAYYTGVLGFTLLEDTGLSEDKRWVRVAPPGPGTTAFCSHAPASPTNGPPSANKAGVASGFFCTQTISSETTRP